MVNGICHIVFVDPEEDDDAEDTGEADEGAESEDAVESELVLPCSMEVPNHGDGEGEDDEVHDYVEDLVDYDEFVAIETLALDAGVPVGA